jgi:hypothetical protein
MNLKLGLWRLWIVFGTLVLSLRPVEREFAAADEHAALEAGGWLEVPVMMETNGPPLEGAEGVDYRLEPARRLVWYSLGYYKTRHRSDMTDAEYIVSV